MTRSPEPEGRLTREFPTPGPLLGIAYRDLYLAADGTKAQKTTIGDAALLPRPWDPPTCHNPRLRAELWDWLDRVVCWVNQEYVWDPEAMIPPCWPQHPHLIHEIAVLADQRRRAGLALDSNGLEEWHRYSLPSFLDRMRSRLKAHCDEGHQSCPARGRNARYSDDRNTALRREAFADDLQPSPARMSASARPTLTIIHPPSGANPMP